MRTLVLGFLLKLLQILTWRYNSFWNVDLWLGNVHSCIARLLCPSGAFYSVLPVISHIFTSLDVGKFPVALWVWPLVLLFSLIVTCTQACWLLPLVLTFTNLIELPYSFAGSFLKSPGIRLAVSSFPTFTPYIFLLSTASVQLSNTTSGWKQWRHAQDQNTSVRSAAPPWTPSLF